MNLRSRGEQIDLDMPDLIDMLVATVEAGVAFSASLQLAAKRMRGPLGEEIRLALQEQSMGLGLNEALGNMLDRQNTQSVRAFVRSLVQGEQLGFDAFGGGGGALPRRREPVTARRAVEQPHTHASFERIEPPEYRRQVEIELFRGARQRAFA